MTRDPIGRDEITAMALRIGPYLRRTPVIDIEPADTGVEARVSLKLELTQHSGSFKARRLCQFVDARDSAGRRRGRFRRQSRSGGRLCRAPPRRKGEDLCAAHFLAGKGSRSPPTGRPILRSPKAHRRSARPQRRGPHHIHAFDQRETLLGQGTIGREIEYQVPDLDTLLVSVGGGGLSAGIAAWYAGRARIVGVEPEGSPTLFRALEAGRPIDANTNGIAADSLAPRRVGELVFPVAQRHISEVVLVSDEAIRAAQEALWRMVRIVAEPGGAAAFAALVSGRYRPPRGERVGGRGQWRQPSLSASAAKGRHSAAASAGAGSGMRRRARRPASLALARARLASLMWPKPRISCGSAASSTAVA